MKLLSAASALALALIPAAASARLSYPGCAEPGAPNNVWYVDLVNGKSPANGGLGTQASPWNSLNGVIGNGDAGYVFGGVKRPALSSVPYYHPGNLMLVDNAGNPPVQPGDQIVLASGNYGALNIGVYSKAVNNVDVNGNTAFVQVVAAPGATPVFTNISATASIGWYFSGLTVQSTKNTLLKAQDQFSQTRDIIFDHMTLSSAPVATMYTWTQNQWLPLIGGGQGLPSQGFLFKSSKNGVAGVGTSCVALTNSSISVIGTGGVSTADYVNLANNSIQYWAEDAIDAAGNYVSITKTTVLDHVNSGDGIHPDVIQLQTGNGGPFHDILIDGTIYYRQTDPLTPFPYGSNGIDTFGSATFNRLTVTNNVLIYSGCSGIVLGGTNLTVANNIVLGDGAAQTYSPTCPDPSFGAYGPTKTAADNVVIVNNIAGSLASWAGADIENNWFTGNGNLPLPPPSGPMTWIAGQGTYGLGNVKTTDAKVVSEFVSYQPSVWQGVVPLTGPNAVNMTPAPGGDFVAGGTCHGAPAANILGAARCPNFTVPVPDYIYSTTVVPGQLTPPTVAYNGSVYQPPSFTPPAIPVSQDYPQPPIVVQQTATSIGAY